jgi:hypothetical protein
MAEEVLLSRPPALLVRAGWETRAMSLSMLLHGMPFYDTKE